MPKTNLKNYAKPAAKPPTAGAPTGPAPAFHQVDSLNGSGPSAQGAAPKGQSMPASYKGFTAQPKPQYDEEGDEKLGDPQTYESAGAAGSGFVNLSHLLGLNKGSGAASAKDFAKKVKLSGEGAHSAIAGAENEFVRQADNPTGLANQDKLDIGGQDWQDEVNKQKGYKYQGPGSLMETSAYADLAKKVGSAQDLATASQTPYGVAGQINKDTGLSATQSAAGAFYMGVNNPNIKRAGSAFTNLQAALDKANARSTQAAQGAVNAESTIHGQADNWQKDIDAYTQSGNETAARSQVVKEATARSDAFEKQKLAEADELNLNPESPDVDQVDDYTYAVWKGVPPEIARNGVDYDTWVSLGRPSWEQYKGSNK